MRKNYVIENNETSRSLAHADQIEAVIDERADRVELNRGCYWTRPAPTMDAQEAEQE